MWEHTLDLSMMDALRMTTQAAEEYLEVGVTTASAGGMPTNVASLLGVNPTKTMGTSADLAKATAAAKCRVAL